MKKLIIVTLLSIYSMFAYTQTNKLFTTMSGGLWFGFNKSTTFIGFVGPKLSITFPASTKTKIEIGLNGIPGATLGKNPRFGLAIGSTLILKREKWKFKPIIGCALVKTDKWQTIYGLGFLF